MKVSNIKQKAQEAAAFAKSGAGFLVISMMVANFINFLFNSFLGRTLSLEDLGLVTLINTLWYLAGIFINGVSSTTNYKISYLSVKEGGDATVNFWKATLRLGTVIACGTTLLWLAAVPFFDKFFHINSITTLAIFAPSIIFGVILAVNKGFLQGNLLFYWYGMIAIVESSSKLLIAGLFVLSGASSWAFISIPLSILITSVVAFILAIKHSKKFLEGKIKSKKVVEYEFPTFFYTASVISSISSIIFLSLDIILVKHFFDPATAGVYSLLALIGKMIYFFGALPGVFMITFVSRAEGLGKNSRTTFYNILLITVLMTVAGFIGLGIYGKLFVPMLFGAKALATLSYLIPYTIAISLFTITNVIVSYHLAKKQYIFPLISLFASVIMCIGIIIDHDAIFEVIRTIFISSMIGFLGVVFAHLLERNTKYVLANLQDFLDAFISSPEGVLDFKGKKILIFNWRDKKHVYAGGAEVYIDEVAKGLISQGNTVTLFCGNDGKSARNEVVDGVKVIRRGGFYMVYVWAFIYYFAKFRGNFDVIIDSHNGIPFFTPLYAKEKVVCIVYHVHQEVFRRSLSFPLYTLACFLERDLMPIVYRNINFVTISESSKKEMLEVGLIGNGIDILYSGIDLEKFMPGMKSSVPLVVYLGRLKDYKSIDVLIEAFPSVISEIPNARLIIAGSGEEHENLVKLADKIGLTSAQISFKGKISEAEKVTLLQEAWVMVNPSFMEGWGITTIEANACGTPVIGSDVVGLRDSVVNNKTGFLFPHGDRAQLALKVIDILKDPALREKMSAAAIAWASRFSWSESVKKINNMLVPALKTGK